MATSDTSTDTQEFAVDVVKFDAKLESFMRQMGISFKDATFAHAVCDLECKGKDSFFLTKNACQHCVRERGDAGHREEDHELVGEAQLKDMRALYDAGEHWVLGYSARFAELLVRLAPERGVVLTNDEKRYLLLIKLAANGKFEVKDNKTKSVTATAEVSNQLNAFITEALAPATSSNPVDSSDAQDKPETVTCSGCQQPVTYNLCGDPHVIVARDSSEMEKVYVQCEPCKALTFLFEQYIHNPVVKTSP